MVKKTFTYNTDELREKAKKESKKGESGSGFPYMKLNKFRTEVLFLPEYPGSKVGLFKKVMVHEFRKGKSLISKATCARAYDEECVVCQFGFNLKRKLDTKIESGAKILRDEQDSWRLFMPVRAVYVNAIKISEGKPSKLVEEKKSELLRLPEGAYQELMEKLEEWKLEDICGLDKGKTLYIKANGKEGLARKYTNFEWNTSAINLLKKGEIGDEEIIIDQMVNLDSLEPEFKVAALEKILRELRRSINTKDDSDIQAIEEDDFSGFDED